MKKVFFCFISLIFALNLNAQSFDFKSFSISANTHITNAILGKTDSFTQPKGSNHAVQSGLSYGLNVETSFSVSPKMNFIVGATFSTLNFKENITGLRWGVDNDNGAYSPSITTIKSNITTLNIPIKGEFMLNKMEGLTFGIAPSFRLDKKGDLNITRISTNKLLDNFGDFLPVKTFNLIASVSFIQRIKLANKINLKLEPVLSLHLLGDELYLSYTKNRFYQYGLNIGIEFQQKQKAHSRKRK